MPSPVVDGATDLPAPIATALTAVVSAATASLDSNLRSIVLFGSGAENRLRPTSDVNVAVVLRAFDAERIAALSETLLAARAAVRLNVMWLLEDEIPHAAEAFAVKFADTARLANFQSGIAVDMDLPVERCERVEVVAVETLARRYPWQTIAAMHVASGSFT